MSSEIKTFSKFEEELVELIQKHNINFIQNYFNGEITYWCFDKERTKEFIFKINDMPDEETIVNFEDNLND